MQVSFEVTAEQRTLQGKSASRRLRRDGKLPAILYGAGKEPVCLQLHHNKMVLQSEHEAFYSHILTLKMPDGTDEKVILKAMQRHPVRPLILHMDFLRINENEELTMRVPLHFLNQDICPAVKSGGGTVIHYAGEVMLSCLPSDLPEYIAVDLLTVGLGQTLHFSDLHLPAGVRIAPLA
ncbi:MAG: 50S ribosomal protein L25/general stress protein Ctc, partial [Gammaproteobacteria bacterium]|nr:50S ribosomal protein L25/general stress protein Ctc [Gammaproteobacteria bacterium]